MECVVCVVCMFFVCLSCVFFIRVDGFNRPVSLLPIRFSLPFSLIRLVIYECGFEFVVLLSLCRLFTTVNLNPIYTSMFESIVHRVQVYLYTIVSNKWTTSARPILLTIVKTVCMITMAKALVEKMERSSTNIEFGENVSLNEKLRLFVLRNETQLANVGSLDFYFSFFFSLFLSIGECGSCKRGVKLLSIEICQHKTEPTLKHTSALSQRDNNERNE